MTTEKDTKKKSTKNQLIFLITAGTIMITVILYAFIFFASFSFSSEHLMAWMQNRQSNHERPYTSDFNIEDFPRSYQNQNLTLEEWILVSSKTTLTNVHLETIRQQLSDLTKEQHPIFEYYAPAQNDESLIEFQAMENPDKGLNFLIKVTEIEYGESNLWKDLNWVKAKQNWETKRTQLIILETYLIFLDRQQYLDPKIYEEINFLTSEIGSQNWFLDFSNHLNDWWNT